MPRSSRQYGPHEDPLNVVKSCKLKWHGHVSRSSGVAKTILQGTVKGGRRRQGRQKERWEDNMKTWAGLDRVRQVPEGSREPSKMEETDCEIICGAPTAFAGKG